MALKLKLSRTSIDATGTKMYISDVTGPYSEDNPGGWGTVNPMREQSNLFFEAKYITSKGEVPIEISPYNPETVENIELNTTSDGYIEVLAVAVPRTAPQSDGEIGTQDGVIVKMVDGAIVQVTVQQLCDDVTFLNSVSFKTVLLARITIYRNRKNIDLIKLRQSKNDDRSHNRDIADLQEKFNFVRSLLDGAIYLWCSDKFIKAQLLIESFNEVIKDE